MKTNECLLMSVDKQVFNNIGDIISFFVYELKFIVRISSQTDQSEALNFQHTITLSILRLEKNFF